MTELKPLSAWALRAASCLRESGEEGSSYADLRDQLGISPQGPLEELRRHRYVIGEQQEHYFLVHDPTSSESPASADAPSAGGPPSAPHAGGSLGAGRLFDCRAEAA